MLSKIILLLCCLCSVYCQDPAGSWLAYTVDKGIGKKLTYMNATWVVPSKPSVDGSFPAFWFGIEPDPALNLIQPILKWLGNEWFYFNEYFQWSNGYDYQSTKIPTSPGQTIFASVSYTPNNNSYTMFITCKETQKSVTTSIAVQGSKIYTQAFIVVEHQPSECAQYPADGVWKVYDINIEYENKPATPSWEAKKHEDMCDCTPVVNSPSSVTFTWKP